VLICAIYSRFAKCWSLGYSRQSSRCPTEELVRILNNVNAACKIMLINRILMYNAVLKSCGRKLSGYLNTRPRTEIEVRDSMSFACSWTIAASRRSLVDAHGDLVAKNLFSRNVAQFWGPK
jgi:hypothetical protein